MSPWEEVTYVLQVKETQFASFGDTTTPSIPANPMRIAIDFSIGIAGQTANVSINPNPGTGHGHLVTQNATRSFTHKDFPGLPQKAWYLNVSATSAMNVTEVIMRDWPADADDFETVGDWSNNSAQGQDQI